MLVLGRGERSPRRGYGGTCGAGSPRTASAVSWASGWVLLSSSLGVGQAVAWTVALEDVAAMGEAVEGGAREAFGALAKILTVFGYLWISAIALAQ